MRRYALPLRPLHSQRSSWTNPVELLSSPLGIYGLLMGRKAADRNPAQTPSADGGRKEDPSSSSSSTGGSSSQFNKEAIGLALVVLVVAGAWDLAKAQWHLISTKLKEVLYVTLEVRSHQDEFDMIMDWLSQNQKIDRCTRNLSFKTYHNIDPEDGVDTDATMEGSGDGTGARRMGHYVPGFGLHVVPFNGKRLWITRSIDEAKKYQNSYRRELDEVISIVCLSRKRDFLDQFMNDVVQNWKRQAQKYVNVYMADESRWDRLCRKAKRPLETLYLPPTTMDVVDEVRRFLKSAEEYMELGVPWRRGYLFEGPPGTGKSSLIFGLAGHFGLPLHILSLKEKSMTDANLIRAINGVPRRSVLVLEDLETVLGAEAQRCDGGVTLSGLLNALDGIGSSDGRILIITANKPELLPPALVRPGRVDRRVRFDMIGDKEIELMVRNFCTGRSQGGRRGDGAAASGGGGCKEGAFFEQCVERAMTTLESKGKTGQRASPADVQNILLDLVTLRST